MAVFVVVAVAGGGIMLWTGDTTETRGINLLVVGVLGLVISMLGAWISLQGR
jgi:hypothetical protein